MKSISFFQSFLRSCLSHNCKWSETEADLVVFRARASLPTLLKTINWSQRETIRRWNRSTFISKRNWRPLGVNCGDKCSTSDWWIPCYCWEGQNETTPSGNINSIFFFFFIIKIKSVVLALDWSVGDLNEFQSTLKYVPFIHACMLWGRLYEPTYCRPPPLCCFSPL